MKRERYKLTFRNIICPLSYLTKHSRVFKKVDTYVRKRLSLDHFIKLSEEFDRVKSYLLNDEELYVFNNIYKFRNVILEKDSEESFDPGRFKLYSQKLNTNSKLLKLVEDNI
jgi:hypothetical protein